MAADEGIKGVSGIAISAGTRRGHAFPIVRLARKPKVTDLHKESMEEVKENPEKHPEEKSEGVDITV
ncbi:MAG: hypothetical protein LLF86_01985 [Nitrospiraceae bacterium]|nr:hypothetical protein [Nitrospiraceae bacterium]